MHRYCRHEIPEVEHDIPMPRKVIDGRFMKREGVKMPESPWIPFLKSLKVGESFVVSHRSVNYVKTKAKELKIDLVWHYNEPEQYKARIWIYGVPGDRRPVYRQVRETRIEVEATQCREEE